MREINCDLCGQLVIKLAPGSLVKPGLIVLCPTCDPSRRKLDNKPRYGEDVPDFLKGLFRK